MSDAISDDVFWRAGEAIADADAILIGAGAGMGVDSGLPDFRGDTGFWKAYPPFRGRRFSDISNPRWFRSDPEQAWGFFGHRFHLYDQTVPHDGFSILRRWGESKRDGYFVFTSNVDGQFQKAGYADHQIVECHGAIHYLQCRDDCRQDIWHAGSLQLDVDENTIRAMPPLPQCRHCTSLARPNILMFGDMEWNHRRTTEQERRYAHWADSVEGKRLAIIELGAGMAIPTVRMVCESHEGCLVRINPREADVPNNGISIPCGALAALRRIDQVIAAAG
jgi:NAD-dependent SIR2 family protein deacetylase